MEAIQIVEKSTILQKQYNELLTRFNKATVFLENSSRTDEEVEQWLPEYQQILKQMQNLCHKIEETSSFKVGIGEFLYGFKNI
jgi:hypothetical protein